MDERIRHVLADTFGITASSLGEAPSPRTVPAWDSLRHMNLVLALEAEFGLEFDEAVVTELTSYGKIRDELVRLGVR